VIGEGVIIVDVITDEEVSVVRKVPLMGVPAVSPHTHGTGVWVKSMQLIAWGFELVPP
jgi:hypothetical protein